jgi:isopenicillin N synthase-like dioxygenase
MASSADQWTASGGMPTFHPSNATDGVPTLDLSCASCDLPSEMAAALRRWGFFYVSHHGVPASLVDEQFAQSAALFALPDETKRGLTFDLRLDIGYSGGNAGVDQSLDPNASGRCMASNPHPIPPPMPALSSRLSRPLPSPDTKEGFMLTNNAIMDYRIEPGAGFVPPDSDPLRGATLRWPPNLPRYRPVIRKYFAALYALNRRLNAVLFSSLGLSDSEAQRLGGQPFVVLKQIRYEASGFQEQPGIGGNVSAAANSTSDSVTAGSLPSVPSRLGAGAHSDWGALTLLANDETPGLQVELHGEWWPVPPRAKCFIVNAGDQIEALSNGEC